MASMTPQERFTRARKTCFFTSPILRVLSRIPKLVLIMLVAFFVTWWVGPHLHPALSPILESYILILPVYISIAAGAALWLAVVGIARLRYTKAGEYMKHAIAECTECARVIHAREPWVCPHCRRENEPEMIMHEDCKGVLNSNYFKARDYIYASFLSRCAFCKKSPVAIRCPGCSKPIRLGSGDIQKPNRWAHLSASAYRDMVRDDEATPEPATRRETLRLEILDRIGSATDLYDIKCELMAEAEKIVDPVERNRHIENVNAAVTDIEDGLPI